MTHNKEKKKMTRPVLLSMKLSKDENAALILWANSEGLDKSVLMRRLFRLALRASAPSSIFPPKIISNLSLTEVEA
jgi:hypothetical protein